LWIEGIDGGTLARAIQALPDVHLVRIWSTPGSE
jgi:hypothetical protein